MNLRCIRPVSLGYLVGALSWACSASDEVKSEQRDAATVGGNSSHTGGTSTRRSAGGTEGDFKNTNGGSGTTQTVATGGTSSVLSAMGGTQATGGTRSTAKTASGGSSSTATAGTSNTLGSAGSTPGGTTGTGGSGSTKATGGTSVAGGSSGTLKFTGGGPAAGGSRASGGSKASGGTSQNVVGGATLGSGGATSSGGSSSTSVQTDGCSDTLALGVTLSEIGVFQSGKISVMQAGSAVTPNTKYNAHIIEGRPAVFRAYVKVDSGFQARPLSARLVLNDGAAAYYAKQTLSASSTELNASNSFSIAVPASAMVAGLNYSLKIVECESGSGTAHQPQFPSAGQAPLTTRYTGPIKITAVAVTANNITPTLDDNFVKTMKAELDAMYPATEAQITVASSPITGCKLTPSTAADGNIWSDCLDLVRSRRTTDRPANDVYYLGVVTPATSLRTFCGNACIAGISFEATASGASGRASLATGYLPDSLDTVAHELGHAQGLEHSPGCGADSTDPGFPYITSNKAYIGWVGWDNRKPGSFLDPAKVTDIMAYCTPQWVSDYVYAQWEDRAATLNRKTLVMGAAEAALWRVLNVVGGRASWGHPIGYPEPPSGDPEGATVLDAQGHAIQETTVYRTPISIDSTEATSAASYMIPEPADSWDAIQIADITAHFQR